MEAFADAQGFYLVNELPWLQYLPSWLPGMGFLKTAEDGYKKSMNMYKTPYEKFKKNLVRLEGYIQYSFLISSLSIKEDGLGYSSFSARLLDSLRETSGEVSQDDEEFTAKVTSIIYAGEC